MKFIFLFFEVIFVCITILSLPFKSSAKKTVTAKEDSLYSVSFYRAATELSATNLPSAIELADSLLENSLTRLHRIKSMMLLATLHQRQGNLEKALGFALKAEKLCELEGNANWSARVSGFLSTTFREIGLDRFAKKFLLQTERLNETLKSPVIQTFVYQEKALYLLFDKKYTGSLDLLKKSFEEIAIIPAEIDRRIFLATSYNIAGDCYVNLKEYQRAQESYISGLNMLNGVQTELRGYILSGLGEVQMHFQNFDSAFTFFEQAEQYAKKSDNFYLHSKVASNMEHYYKSKGDIKMSLKYNKKLLLLIEENAAQVKSISNNLLGNFEIDSNKNALRIKYAVSSICALLVIILLLIYIYRRKNKEIKTRYEAIVNHLKNSRFESLSSEPTVLPFIPLNSTLSQKDNLDTEQAPGTEELLPKEKVPLISKETELRLLKELKQLEDESFFLQKDITLSVLAVKLNTNQKYVSYLINQHKGMDYSNYVNTIRILYILDKLQNDAVYLNYKIAHLAEECGFSSHSKFTEVFKSQTGLLPSTFIAEHKRNRRA